MRRGVIALALLALLLVGCGIPVTSPTGGGGQAWLCEFVRDNVRQGVMEYEYAAYYYPQCQPLPALEAGA